MRCKYVALTAFSTPNPNDDLRAALKIKSAWKSPSFPRVIGTNCSVDQTEFSLALTLESFPPQILSVVFLGAKSRTPVTSTASTSAVCHFLHHAAFPFTSRIRSWRWLLSSAPLPYDTSGAPAEYEPAWGNGCGNSTASTDQQSPGTGAWDLRLRQSQCRCHVDLRWNVETRLISNVSCEKSTASVWFELDISLLKYRSLTARSHSHFYT